MTTMMIDYKAETKRADEMFKIDRRVWKDIDELIEECMSKEVYLIKVFVDGKEVRKVYNN